MSKMPTPLSCAEISRNVAIGLRTVKTKRDTWISARDALLDSGKLPKDLPMPDGPTHGEVLALQAAGLPVPESTEVLEAFDRWLEASKESRKAKRKIERDLGLDKLYDAFSDASRRLTSDISLLRRMRAMTLADLHAKIRTLDLLAHEGDDFSVEVVDLARSIRRDADALLGQPVTALAA
ncbi:MAG: hypothetical protein JWL84_1514 [Rhodospirillales bacterium]|nr:hypothetical protein [Rhodospirillales bacterium]